MAAHSLRENSALGKTQRPFIRRDRVVITLSLLLIAIVHLWLLTGGTFSAWPNYTRYYPALTDAFAHGQTSLLVQPPPALLALPDPYDPHANSQYRLHDALLFNGNYYLYWGPAPALVPGLLLSLKPAAYDDEILCIFFLFGTIILATILMVQLRARLFPRQSALAILPPLFTLGLGTPALRTAGVYGAAIMGGQFFLLAGLCAAWFGFSARRAWPLWFLAAGTCWALSGGSRVSLPPALAALAVCTARRLCRQSDQPSSRRLLALTGLVLPPAIGACLMAWYNFARFHSFTEFGIRYQLAARRLLDITSSQELSAQFILPNLTRYLFEPPWFHNTFPFLWARNSTNKSFIDNLFTLPPTYHYDWLLGLVWTQPFLIFAVVMPFVAARRRPLFQQDIAPSEARLGVWLIVTLLLAEAAGSLMLLVFFASVLRYMMDFIPGVTILAAVGYWWILNANPRRRWIPIAVTLLIIYQCLLGLLMGIDGPNEDFGRRNPALYHSIYVFFNSIF